jgi:hypothetical protein
VQTQVNNILSFFALEVSSMILLSLKRQRQSFKALKFSSIDITQVPKDMMVNQPFNPSRSQKFAQKTFKRHYSLRKMKTKETRHSLSKQVVKHVYKLINQQWLV